ncbi:MAG: signal transduction histidine kinase [Verrucomicrobiales bacterium]|jgi:signal transduction histidine kinase
MNYSSMRKLSANYLAALRLHDKDDLESHLQIAQNLGVTAVDLGLGTLELAKIHAAALTAILTSPTSAKDEEVRTIRASHFFNEALTPIEMTHRSAVNAAAELHGIRTDLDQRTKDLVASQRQLAREIEERKSTEDALRTSEENAADLLVDSKILEEELRAMTRRTLSANEAERKQMSLHLQDDIAQAMLGIHVRLLALKVEVSTSNEDLTEQITGTERLMAQSVKSIGSFASALNIDRENSSTRFLPTLSIGLT